MSEICSTFAWIFCKFIFFMKKFYSILVVVLLGVGNLCAESGLLGNGGFESNSCSAMFGCSFDDWSWNGSGASVETNDIWEGAEAMRVQPARNGILEQDISLTDDEYAAGTTFQLTLHYKALSLPEGGSVSMDCYWTPVGSGNADEMKQHDAEILQRTICTSASDAWQELVVSTGKPAGSSKLLIRLLVSRNADILFDGFSLTRIETNEPFIHVTPGSVGAVETTIGNSVDFQPVRLEHGNVEAPTTCYIGGEDRAHFRLSQSELAAEDSACTIIVTYEPLSAGTHSASLIFDNTAHTTILPDIISLHASCTDPDAIPSITVTPGSLTDFETVAGKQVTKSLTVKTENCTDGVFLSVSHVMGTAFTTASSQLPKNWESEVTIYFSPVEAGTYQSTLTISTAGAEPVVMTLNGTAAEQSEENIDWATDFVWDDSAPLAVLNEDFGDVRHNQTVALEGWQNVAAADARPWRGQNDSLFSYITGNNKCAKASAYQFGRESTGTWEMWLVTPALDYKNAPKKTFGFSVKGEYMPEENNPTSLELVYMDATNPQNVFLQTFDNISIPSTADENELWVPFVINLADQPYMDVFHFAFRFTGPNGTLGTVTYYIDNITWGVLDMPEQGMENPLPDRNAQGSKIIENGMLYLLYNGIKYNVQGTRVY